MGILPWDCNPDLTEERLTKMAGFIAMIRNEVIDLHDDALGDTRLALGMRTYECCRSRIISLAVEGSFPWLSILTPEGRFTFAIGDTPVRFTRNDPNNLPDRKLIASEDAMEQMTLFGDHPHAEVRWFFVFDTHYKSAADAVYFVGYSESGEVVCKWQVPVEDGVTLLSEVAETLSTAVELDQAPISIKQTIKQVNKKQQ